MGQNRQENQKTNIGTQVPNKQSSRNLGEKKSVKKKKLMKNNF